MFYPEVSYFREWPLRRSCMLTQAEGESKSRDPEEGKKLTENLIKSD